MNAPAHLRPLPAHREALPRPAGALDARANAILLAAVVLLCLLPFLLAPIPEQSDTANHVARIRILLDHAAGGPLGAVYRVHWRWIGNLGVDLPALLLARWLGVEQAVTVVDALIAPLTLIGMLAAVRAAHGRLTAGACLALPLLLSQTFLWGFLNFNLSIALALLVMAAWVRRPPQGLGRALLFGGGALGVWTAHAMGWGVLVVAVAGLELPCLRRGVRVMAWRALCAAPLLAPLVPMSLWREPGGAPLFHYDPGLLGTKVMDFATVLRGVSKPLDLALVGLIWLAALALVLSAWHGARRRPAAARLASAVEPRLAGAGGLLMLAVLVAPTTIMDSWGADLRLAPIAVTVALLSLRPLAVPRTEGVLALAGLLLFGIRAGEVAAAWQQAGERHQRQLALLERLPAGGRVGYLQLLPDCGTPWTIGPERHLGSYLVTRRQAFTNTSFVVRGADLVTVRDPGDAARWVDGSQAVPAVRCPGGAPDPGPIRAAVARMAPSFAAIWIVGSGAAPTPRGWHVLGQAPGSVLIARDVR